jgi:hypothetical protein
VEFADEVKAELGLCESEEEVEADASKLARRPGCSCTLMVLVARPA